MPETAGPGNAYVDMAATPGMPMIALMNRLGYDVATLGNHEFDHGQAFLGRMIDSMAFEVVCANVTSDTCTFPQLPPYVVLDKDGIRIGFVGVVTNYEGPGHPAGNASSFEGLEFPDPQAMAMKYAAELRPKVDLLVLVSHMGDDRDVELLGKETRFDVVIGGHTHVKVDSLVNGTLLTQTGKYLEERGRYGGPVPRQEDRRHRIAPRAAGRLCARCVVSGRGGPLLCRSRAEQARRSVRRTGRQVGPRQLDGRVGGRRSRCRRRVLPHRRRAPRLDSGGRGRARRRCTTWSRSEPRSPRCG